MKKINGLPVFAVAGLVNEDSAMEVLRSDGIKKVVCCALGPSGTNIEQSAKQWLKRLGIVGKSEVVLGDTPERCLILAREIVEDGVVAVFWTCAVYYNENQFFFGNPDVYPFFFQEAMLLDSMQLATRPNRVADAFCFGTRIASHPSPAPLVKDLAAKVVLCNSNAAAAKMCAEGETDLCITTEAARKIYDLVELHSFGCPNMVFFGGITQHGLDQIKKCCSPMVPYAIGADRLPAS